MKNPVLQTAVVLLSLGIIACPAYADVWDKSWNVSGNAQVRLNVDDGNIRVETGDFRQVRALVKTVGWRIAEDEVRVLERQAGDSLEIEVKVPSSHMDWHIRREITVELTVPRTAGLDLHTSDGNINTHGAEGSLRADTGDGNVTAIGAKGTIRLRTGDGNIDADELEGSLAADTGDGNVTVVGQFEVLDVQTGDGNLEVTAYAGSRLSSQWKLRTGDGNISLRLPDGVGANLDATTGDGRVTLDFPVQISGKVDPTAVRGPMNGGGPQLYIHTGDGNIKIEKR